MAKMARMPSNSISYSSVKNTAVCNKMIFMINKRVNLVNESRSEYDKLWIIDSGASHHVTNELRDFTSYKPYATPEKIQTANMHDSLMIVGEGTVFFDTRTTNGQIHIVHLDNVCYSDSNNCPNVWYFWLVGDIASHQDQMEPKYQCM
jgi:hypothetical protein